MFTKELSKAMVRLEQSHEKKHVTMVTNIDEMYPDMPYEQKRMAFSEGFTTHPNLELVQPFQLCYQLKAGCSASDTLESMLTEHITMIDCVTAACLAHYLALLETFKTHWGVHLGKERFDKLFGHRDGSTPYNRKMIFSMLGINMGTNIMPYESLRGYAPCPVQPLSYIFRIHETKDLYSADAGIGSIVSFRGDDGYVEKHPLGGGGAFSGIFTESPNKIQSFGCGKQALTPTQLLEIHMKSFSQPPSKSSLAELDLSGKCLKDVENITCDVANVGGLCLVQPNASKQKIHSMVFDEIDGLIKSMNQYISDTLDNRPPPPTTTDLLTTQLSTLLSENLSLETEHNKQEPSIQESRSILPSSSRKEAVKKPANKKSEGGLFDEMKRGFL